jgi:hypothetical protein
MSCRELRCFATQSHYRGKYLVIYIVKVDLRVVPFNTRNQTSEDDNMAVDVHVISVSHFTGCHFQYIFSVVAKLTSDAARTSVLMIGENCKQ